MAAAYTFYTIIFKKDPTLAAYKGNLTPSQAQFIKNIVKTKFTILWIPGMQSPMMFTADLFISLPMPPPFSLPIRPKMPRLIYGTLEMVILPPCKILYILMLHREIIM
jgi:hypothetical protein